MILYVHASMSVDQRSKTDLADEGGELRDACSEEGRGRVEPLTDDTQQEGQ